MPGFIHSSYLGQCLYAVLVLMVLLPEVTTLLKKVTSSIEEFHLQGDINPRPPGQWSCGLPTDHGTALKKKFSEKGNNSVLPCLSAVVFSCPFIYLRTSIFIPRCADDNISADDTMSHVKGRRHRTKGTFCGCSPLFISRKLVKPSHKILIFTSVEYKYNFHQEKLYY